MLIDSHRPSAAFAREAIAEICGPESPTSLFQLDEAFCLRNYSYVGAVLINSMQAHHLNETYTFSSAHPRSCNIHSLGLESCNKMPELCMVNGERFIDSL